MEIEKQTHSGNLNRSKIVATGKEGPKATGKSNDPEATLRTDSLPKGGAVTTLPLTDNSQACIKCAQKQNTSDGKEWPLGRNVIPAKGNSLDVDVIVKSKDE